MEWKGGEQMYVSSYLERLKIKLAALPLDGQLTVEDNSEVLNAWGDMDLGELEDAWKPVGRWHRLTVTPYEEFIIWCYQHGIHAYFQDGGAQMVFIRAQIERTNINKLMMEIPLVYHRVEQTNFSLMQMLVNTSLEVMRTLRAGGTGRGLARVLIYVVLIAFRFKADLGTELFNQIVNDKLEGVAEPEVVAVPHR